jgi:hypothetical protein
MYDTLLYPHHVITDTVKEFILLDKNDTESLARGYLAIKDVDGKKIKFFISENLVDCLPIRIEDVDEFFIQDKSRQKSIIQFVKNPVQFRIKPEQTFQDVHEFINEFAPFEHSKPELWLLNKLIAMSSLISKTFIGISSEPEFGKSSIYEILHAITKRCPVFQPRSIPGILAQITGDGNIVFDEVQKSSQDVKMCMENFTLQVAAGKPVYINGALQSSHTKPRYDVAGQSITYLYNLFSNYKNPEEEFFDNVFSNNDAIDSRLLKVKFDGVLLEKFDKDFDMVSLAKQNIGYYIKVAKMLLWLKELKRTNSYKRRFITQYVIEISGRKKLVFDELSWLMDVYAVSQDEYSKLVRLLEDCLISYQEMLGRRLITKDVPSVKKSVVQGTLKPVEEDVLSSVCCICADDAIYEKYGKHYCRDCFQGVK